MSLREWDRPPHLAPQDTFYSTDLSWANVCLTSQFENEFGTFFELIIYSENECPFWWADSSRDESSVLLAHLLPQWSRKYVEFSQASCWRGTSIHTPQCPVQHTFILLTKPECEACGGEEWSGVKARGASSAPPSCMLQLGQHLTLTAQSYHEVLREGDRALSGCGVGRRFPTSIWFLSFL